MTRTHVPERTCVGCRNVYTQADLVRFTRAGADWRADAEARAPGRGVYLCSAACAKRAIKNKRYAGLGAVAVASEVAWKTDPTARRPERRRV